MKFFYAVLIVLFLITFETLCAEDNSINKELPLWKPPLSEPNPENFNKVIMYNTRTKKETIIDFQDYEKTDLKSKFGNEGIYKIDTLNDTLSSRNFGDLYQVSNPDEYPWRVNVKLLIYFNDQNDNIIESEGSGVLIDPITVLTAGHCIYKEAYGYAVTVQVIPGYEAWQNPYGYASSTESGLMACYEWIYNQNYDFDMGIITIDRPVGCLTGWNGYGYNSDNSFFTNDSNLFQNPGYPAEGQYNGLYMYNWNGNFDYVEPINEMLLYNFDVSYKGQSGSGVYNNDDYVEYGVLSHAIELLGMGLSTGFVRITENKFNTINNIISANTPTTYDLSALNVNIEPTSVIAGHQLSSFDFVLVNYSAEALNDNVALSVYLSTDSWIDSNDDILISTFDFNYSLQPIDFEIISLDQVSIPYSIEAGDYHIGLIIDNNDANILNNIAQGWDTDEITVIEPDSPILTNGLVTPQTGNPNTNFNFSVTYTDPANQAPDYVNLIVGSNTYSMTGSGTWSSGVEFTTTHQFSVENYDFHFEGYANGQSLRFPSTGELGFIVESITGEGVTLSFSQNPFVQNQTMQISATINPPISNYPINFYQNPTMGQFAELNPIYTNSTGIATVSYGPLELGDVTIGAIDANNPDNYDMQTVEIILAPPPEFIILISTSYVTGDEYSAEYMIRLDIYESNGNQGYYEEGTITTDMGTFSNGQNTIAFTTNHNGEEEQSIFFNTEGACNLTVQVQNSFEYHNFTVVFLPPPIQLQPFLTIQANSVQSFDWHPDSDTIYFNSQNDICVAYSISQQSITNNYVFEADGADLEIIRVSPDGNKIAISSVDDGDDYVKIFDINTGQQLAIKNYINPRTRQNHGNICWIDNQKLLVADGYDTGGWNSLILNYTGSSTLQTLATLRNNTHNPCDADVGGNKIAISYDDDNHDGDVGIWNSNGNFLFNIDPHPYTNNRSYGLSISDDGTRIAVYEDDNETVKIYDSNGVDILTIPFNNIVWELEWQPGSNRYLFSICRYNDIKLWDIENGTVISVYPSSGSNTQFSESRWSPDGNMFALMDYSDNILIFSPFDQEGPSISITSPSDSSSTQLEQIDVIGLVSDENGVSSVQCSINNGTWEGVTVTGSQFTHSVSLIPGINIITIQATDNYLNTSETSVHVTRLIDEDPPFITGPEISNSNPEIGEQITFSALIQDGWSGVDATTVISYFHNTDSTFVQSNPMFDDGTNGDITPGDEIYTCIISTTGFIESQYFIDVSASDNSSNSITVNNIETFNPFDLPEYTDFIVQPSTITISDSVTITVTITDQSGIINSILYYDTEPMELDNNLHRKKLGNCRETGIAMQDIGNSQFQATIQAQNAPEVYYYIEAMDGLGHTGISSTQSYLIFDNLAPIISNILQIPDDVNEDIQGYVEVRATITDLGYAGVQDFPQLRYQRGENYEPFSAFLDMTYLGNDIYSFMIPEPPETWDYIQNQSLSYEIDAYDNSYNQTTSQIFVDFIEPINDPPIFNFTEDITFPEDASTIYDFSNFVIDDDNPLDDLTLSWTGNDSINIVQDGWELTFSSNVLNWNGTENITFTIDDNVSDEIENYNKKTSDSSRSSTSETITVYCNPVNDPPTITLPDNFTFNEDEDLIVDFTDFIDDIDPDDLTLSVSGNTNVIVNINELEVTFSSTLDWNETETLTFTVNDNATRATAEDVVDVIVLPVNDDPTIILPDDFTFEEDDGLVVDFADFVNDVDLDVLTLLVTGNTEVTVDIVDLEVTFGATADWNGTETLTFTVDDGQGDSVSFTTGRRSSQTQKQSVGENCRATADDVVNIIVTPMNDDPTIVLPDDFTFEEDDGLVVDFTDFIYDIDLDDLTLTVIGNIEITVDIVDFEVTFGATADWNGTETLTFIVDDDATRATAEDDVYVIVTAVNDEPVLNNFLPEELEFTLYQDSIVTFYVEVEDIDSDLLYAWFVNNDIQTENSETFIYQFYDLGAFEIKSEVSDEEYQIDIIWDITVEEQVGSENLIPIVTKLKGNYPNPFNPTTKISYSIVEESIIHIDVYNIKGHHVKSLINRQHNAGDHSVIWNGKDANSNNVSSGLYFYKLNVNGKTVSVKKCLLLK